MKKVFPAIASATRNTIPITPFPSPDNYRTREQGACTGLGAFDETQFKYRLLKGLTHTQGSWKLYFPGAAGWGFQDL